MTDSSQNYHRSTNIQVLIDADTRLAIAVADPLPGSSNDTLAYREFGIPEAVGDAHVTADGGYQGNSGVIMPYRKPAGRELLDWQDNSNKIHKRIRARVEHAFGGMKNWRILRDCRLKGQGVMHAASAAAHMRNLTLTYQGLQDSL